jgi:predicted NBD/HSP70 family sugar kinase
MIALKNYQLYDINTYRVFQCIVQHGPITKRKLQECTGLSWGSISNNTSKLLRVGAIKQNKSKQGVTSGRIPIYFDINDKDNLCIGIDATLGKVTGVVATLKGECLSSETNLIYSNQSSVIIQSLMIMLENIIAGTTNRKSLKAIGVALPGTIAKTSGRYYFEHPFQGVFPANLKEMIEERFGIETQIFQDPDCLLAAEINMMDPKDMRDNILSLRWSHGIGMSILLDGKLYHGTSGLSGEIGHMVIDPKGPLCSCGNQGCLEIYSSVHAVLSQVQKLIKTGECKISTGRDGIVHFDDVLYALDKGDPCVVKVMLEAIRTMAIALANTINITDPELVIVGGEYAGMPKEYFEVFQAATMQHVMKGSEVHIRQSTLDSNAAALGAALLLVDKVYYKQFDTAFNTLE